MRIDDDVHIRAVLFVPIKKKDNTGTEKEYLRALVANRDEGTQKHPEYAVGTPGPAQDAFAAKTPKAYPDSRSFNTDRQYKSSAAFPVSVRGLDGDILAVITLDADALNTFTDAHLSRLEQAIGPFNGLLGLLRITEKAEG